MSITNDRYDYRQNFIRHFAHFGSVLRYPFPFAGFAGKPNGKHDNLNFDENGFRNLSKSSYRPDGSWPRVFVIGGSTMVEGDTEDDTVPGRLQSSLIQAGYLEAQVFNFGTVSTCFKQMSALAWSYLADLRPDMLVVVGGGTDLTNPWTFDPRPGYPYNAFVMEQIYDFIFDPSRISRGELGLGYDELTSLLYTRLEQARAASRWRTAEWELAIVDSARNAVGSFSLFASALRVPVLCILQPTIVRKKHLTQNEQNVGSREFLEYLDRQYGRLEDVFYKLSQDGNRKDFYFVHSLSDKFAYESEQIFYDSAHYLARGRQMMAEDLSYKVRQVLNRRSQNRSRWTLALQHIRSWIYHG